MLVTLALLTHAQTSGTFCPDLPQEISLQLSYTYHNMITYQIWKCIAATVSPTVGGERKVISERVAQKWKKNKKEKKNLRYLVIHKTVSARAG